MQDRAPKCAVTRDWQPGGDTGLPAKTQAACERGGSAYSPAFPKKSLCRKDTWFNYFLLKRILDNFSLAKGIFAISAGAGINHPAEGGKQGQTYRIIRRMPFRMPLHPQHKARGGRQ